MMFTEDRLKRCEERLDRAEKRLRATVIGVVVFFMLHVVLVPLLPKLFDKEPAITVALLVLGVVVASFAIVRRIAD